MGRGSAGDWWRRASDRIILINIKLLKCIYIYYFQNIILKIIYIYNDNLIFLSIMALDRLCCLQHILSKMSSRAIYKLHYNKKKYIEL